MTIWVAHDVSDSATPWTVAHQAPLSGLPFPSPGDLPDPGIEPRSPALEADILTSEPPEKPQVKVVRQRKANSV